MIDIKELKEKILEDENNIRLILEEIGCSRITGNSNEYRCAKDESDTNPTRVCVKLNESLSSKIYDLTPVKGDIFTLIMELTNKTFTQSIGLVCKILGIEFNSNEKYVQKTPRKSAFGGFYSKVKKEQELIYNCYDESLLSKYLNKGNTMFKRDNIEYDVQSIFNIMYDIETNRVVTPWRDSLGRIIGIMGRYNANAEYCNDMGISKWLPLKDLSFPKSNFLYGLYENYQYILREGRVYVGESEKFVLQLVSMGIRNCVSVGSHDISNVQRRLLLSLGVEIVTVMDNDIPAKFNETQCLRLKSKSSLLNRNVGFSMVYGILEGKQSASDCGIEIWNKCIEEDNIYWV